MSDSYPVMEDDIDAIEKAIDEYLQYYRSLFPRKIYPKLHMLEDHIIPLLKTYHFGCGLLGEQGGEGVHAAFNRINRSIIGCRSPLQRITCTVKDLFYS